MLNPLSPMITPIQKYIIIIIIIITKSAYFIEVT